MLCCIEIVLFIVVFFFQCANKIIYSMSLFTPKNVGIDSKSIIYVKYWESYWVFTNLLNGASNIGGHLGFQVVLKTIFIQNTVNCVWEKHHNGCRHYIERTYEKKNCMYARPCNVWLYCIASSSGGHLGFHMFINMPSWELYIHLYASVWLKTQMMVIFVKKMPESKHIYLIDKNILVFVL